MIFATQMQATPPATNEMTVTAVSKVLREPSKSLDEVVMQC